MWRFVGTRTSLLSRSEVRDLLRPAVYLALPIMVYAGRLNGRARLIASNLDGGNSTLRACTGNYGVRKLPGELAAQSTLDADGVPRRSCELLEVGAALTLMRELACGLLCALSVSYTHLTLPTSDLV